MVKFPYLHSIPLHCYTSFGIIVGAWRGGFFWPYSQNFYSKDINQFLLFHLFLIPTFYCL